MRNKKRMISQFTFYDRTGIQELLEKQAQKGWLLEKISSYGWKFRRIEPANINYAVTYFPSASVFDPQPSEKQKQFWDFCEHTGWKLAAHNAQLQVFYNEQQNPIPIETDAQIELENIEKSAKKGFLPGYYMLFGVGILQMILSLWRLSENPIEYLSMNASLFSILAWVVLLLMTSIEIIGFYRWCKKARKAVETDGSFTATKGYRKVQLALMWFVLGAMALYLLSIDKRIAAISLGSVITVGLISVSIQGITKLLKIFNVSAKVNRNITIVMAVVISFAVTGLLLIAMVNSIINSGLLDREVAYTYEYNGRTFKVYDDELPLLIQDIVETDYDGYSTSWYGNESIIMSCHDAFQNPKMSDLEQFSLQYTLVKVKMPFFYNLACGFMLKDFARNYGVDKDDEFYKRAVEIPASEWGAEKAYQLYIGEDYADNEYLLFYNDSIIAMRPDSDMELTAQAKANIGKKLNEQ